MFVVVCAEMFKRSTYAVLLNAFDISGTEFSRKIGILREIFEISSAERRSLYVHAGTEQYIYFLVKTLLAESVADFFGKIFVPCRGKRNRRRKSRCGEGTFQSDIVVFFVFLTEAVRTVRHDKTAYAESRHGFCFPEVFARTQRRFFFKRHFGNEFFNFVFVHKNPIFACFFILS